MQPENIIWRIEPVRVFFAWNPRVGGSDMSQVSETVCSNCHSTMPAELRFCRNCGFRLTGSTGGYTGSQYAAAPTDSAALKKKRRISGMSWIFVGLLVFFVCAAAFTALIAPLRKTANIVQRTSVVKSYIGVDEFNTTDQGVIFNAVTNDHNLNFVAPDRLLARSRDGGVGSRASSPSDGS